MQRRLIGGGPHEPNRVTEKFFRPLVSFSLDVIFPDTYQGTGLGASVPTMNISPQIDCAPQRTGHASLPGPTAPLVTERLQLPVPGYGTVYRHISEMLR